ncbi:MAG: hypothetical protein IKK10_01610 [Clostridia bacterium]|nr:hypothetical protein [Clostridia bacterium]
MTTEQTSQAVNNETVSAVPAVSKRRKIFAKTFGVPGFIFALISMWFTIAQSLVAITASEIAEVIAEKFLRMSLSQIMNIPMLGLCSLSMMWAMFAVALCALSRFLGTSTKINQTGFILSIVSVICSVSLACFSIVYMILS